MGTLPDDEARRTEHRRLNKELEAHLDRAAEKRAAEQAAARRTRLHSFGIAGRKR